jgi:hypothetical protein
MSFGANRVDDGDNDDIAGLLLQRADHRVELLHACRSDHAGEIVHRFGQLRRLRLRPCGAQPPRVRTVRARKRSAARASDVM